MDSINEKYARLDRFRIRELMKGKYNLTASRSRSRYWRYIKEANYFSIKCQVIQIDYLGSSPDLPFYNFRASKCVDRRIARPKHCETVGRNPLLSHQILSSESWCFFGLRNVYDFTISLFSSYPSWPWLVWRCPSPCCCSPPWCWWHTLRPIRPANPRDRMRWLRLRWVASLFLERLELLQYPFPVR